MANLFDISKKHYDLLTKLEDEIMEFDAPNEDTIEELNISLDEVKDKIDAYYYFIKMKEGEIATIDDEVKRLNNKVKVRENLIERLKKAVIQALELAGETTKSGGRQIKTENVTVWNVYHKPLVIDEDFDNDEYINYIIKDKFDKAKIEDVEAFLEFKLSVDKKIDTTKLKEALKAGETVDNAHLDKNASYVRFK